MGHVLGFVHEHQRIDRTSVSHQEQDRQALSPDDVLIDETGDSYVKYNCLALYDYHRAEQEVAVHLEWNRDMGEICASNFLATTPELQWYGPSDYSKDMGTAFHLVSLHLHVFLPISHISSFQYHTTDHKTSQPNRQTSATSSTSSLSCSTPPGSTLVKVPTSTI
jgi:hypothetical protein